LNSKQKGCNLRLVNNGGTRFYFGKIPLAHFIWNYYNPDNKYYYGLVIHHIDENPLNDDINNLQLMTKEEHISLHHKNNKNMLGKKHSEETKRKISNGNKGKQRSGACKIEMSERMKGKKMSELTKSRMSEAKKGNKYTLGYKHSEEAKKKISGARRRKVND
jgi:hypothetical protein